MPAKGSKRTLSRALVARAVRRDLSLLRQPRRLLAIGIIGLAGGLALAFIIARGELAGADARAYWAAVRVWLSGGDPYDPPAPFMPYPYAPWLLPLLAPLGLLPWHVLWFVWRGLNVVLLVWSAAWAYRRHPLATAAVLAALMPSIAVTLDTGNINLVLALAIWAAQFCPPRVGGAIWALTVSTKWFPVFLFVFLPPRTRLWALASLGVAVVLSLATFPETLTWIETMVAYPRPLRIDYLVLLWAAVPWLWRASERLWWLRPRQLGAFLADVRGRLGGWWQGLRRDPEAAALEARQGVQARVRAFFGAS